MDNFMDKIAQKLGAQDVIRANSAADAAQIEKMQSQVAEYDGYMQEMRKLNLKNAENEQKLQELLDKSSADILRLTEEAINKINQIKENEKENDKNPEIEETLTHIQNTASENIATIQELFAQSSDFVHKENVKVYRNVQAAMVEELEKQTQVFNEAGKKDSVKVNQLFIIGTITMIAALANVGLLIVQLLGIF